MFGALLGWWYGLGWQLQLKKVAGRFARWTDYFSFGLLARTIFAPFRQIAAGQVSGSIELKFHFWLDRVVSRSIGAVVRIMTLLFGSVFMIVVAFASVLQLMGWLVLPIIPIIGLICSVAGWLPWTK